MKLEKPSLRNHISFASTTYLILVLLCSNVYAAGSIALLNVKLADVLDQSPLSNIKVYAFQRQPDNSLVWSQNKISDASGLIDFDFQGLGEGVVYVLKTQRLDGNGWVVSGDITNAGSYTLYVRNVRVTAINGSNNLALTNHEIHVYQRNSSNQDTWFTSAKTNTSGVADFSLPNLTSGQRYIFKSRSPVDTDVWYIGKEINQTGASTFVIGNKALSVELVNTVDQQAITNFEVSAYKRLPDNSLKWVQKQISDATGKVNFDLQGLGINTVYVLEAKQQQGKSWIRSGDINNTEDYAFNVRNIRVTALNGLNNSPLIEHKIHVFKRDINGQDSWFTSSTTNASGLADFYLPGLSSGLHYVLKSLSPVDDKVWYESERIDQSGAPIFVVGNKLLNVQLVNAIDQQPVANIAITAYQRLPDNSLQWFQRRTSDTNGRADFDLQGLGKDRQYILKTAPYNIEIFSKDITETGSFIMQTGKVAVTLRRKTDSSVIVGQKLQLLEKVSPGQLEWRASSTTNQKGMVHFDPEGLDAGKVFVIYAQNLLGNNLRYYSKWISSKGQLEFTVDLSDPHKLDEELPVFTMLLPQNNASLSDKGFNLTVKAIDNYTVSYVEIKVVDPIKGVALGQATLNNNEWHFSVTSSMISAGQVIMVEAQAIDHVGNKAQITYQYSISSDLEAPIVKITSHRDGDRIDENGFLLMGTASDNTGYVKLLATVINSSNGIIIDQKDIEISTNQLWALTVKDLLINSDVQVKLSATDSAGNVASKDIVLNTSSTSPNMTQLISRITFGATPELLQELRNDGAINFINQQLHPELIDDSAFEQQLNDILAAELGSSDQLQNSQIARAIFSKRQLLEVMTQFWDNHFNTDLGKVKNSSLEDLENKQFRIHALGNFRDLLGVSAKSPAMLRFLDNKDSHKDEPNENYARELMELHTLGVDNGYTSEDIVEIARVFTGWSTSYGEFYYNQWEHDDDGEKTVLGITIPSGLGATGGEVVLDILASQDATAHYICTKLIQKFVSDSLPEQAISDCALDFQQHIDQENQIALVLEGVFKSQEFSDNLNFHNKVKTPLEFFAGLSRQLSVSIDYYKSRQNLSVMGMPLFYYSLPTGWPEKAEYWANSNQLIMRWQVARDVAFNSSNSWKNHITLPAQSLIQQGIETSEGVLGYLFELALSYDYLPLEWEQALFILTNNETEKFDIYAPDADMKIRKVIALILQYPTYQLQ